MNYRMLGKTGLKVSEIGLGGEWLERHSYEEVKSVVDACRSYGVNIIDCFMSEPNVRSNLGNAIQGEREKWIIQGHLGSAWRNGQYVRTRNIPEIKEAFADLLERFHTDYIDLGMIHFVDRLDDWQTVLDSGFMDLMVSLKADGAIHHIGLSTHNPEIARLAVEHGVVETLLFSINPGYDLIPSEDNVGLADSYAPALRGMDGDRADLYRLCAERGVGITVMKCFGGGRLLDAKRSPFGVALTPVQCIHYCLTRPAVATVMLGFDNAAEVPASMAYMTADESKRDYATVLSSVARETYYTHCTYCGHCKPCPVNLDIAMVNKLLDLATAQPFVPDTVRAH
ncbi:MAG: aldo/keto reductase, partial [Clostridia bacterium]|nr:aldo/keto reductase [Clostridia bacterium]